MEFSSQTPPPGFRFSPTDQELVRFFLYPKVTNPLFTTSAPVRDYDLYAHQPLHVWNEFHRLQGEDVFLFTNLKKKSHSHASRKIAGSLATWHGEHISRPISVTIDKHCSITAFRKVFSYRNPESSHHSCRWTMYEYSLPSLSEVTVLCQLRKKDDNKNHQKKTRRRRRHADRTLDDATNTMSQNARVGEGYDQHHITASTETERGRFDSLESLTQALFQDNDNDQMECSVEQSDIFRELLGLIVGGGGSDLADRVPSIL